MPTRLHLSLIIALAVAIWTASLQILGVEITWRHAAPFTVAVTVLTGVCVVFDRWLWRWRIFKGWLVKQPDLQGSWKVLLVSSWIDPATQRQVAPIECVMVIRQRFSALSARLFTRESSSSLVAHAFTCEDDGVFEFIGTYTNTPKVDLRGKRSEIHHGSFLLHVKGDPPNGLDGHYWTDRGTKGSLQLTQRVDTLYPDYESARAEMNLPSAKSETPGVHRD